MALSKLKDQSERLTIADEVLRLAAVEEEKAEPDPVVFHNGCLLLYDLQCEMQFSQYADRYANLIEQAYGLDAVSYTHLHRSQMRSERQGSAFSSSAESNGAYWSFTRWLLTFTGMPPISVCSSLSTASLKARRRSSGMACHLICKYTS